MIDWARVNELRDEVGEEDFDEVVLLFLSEVEERLAEMMSATEPRNIEDDMHFLKGSALNLGFADLAELCQRGEASASKNDGIIVTATQVNDVYQSSKAHFLKLEENRAA